MKAHDEEIKKVEVAFKTAKKAHDEAVKNAAADLNKVLKETTAVRLTAHREHDALVKTATKVLAEATKTYDKAKAAADKGNSRLNGQLDHLKAQTQTAAVIPAAGAPVKRGPGRPRKVPLDAVASPQA
jgi:hypothetical protein